MTKQDLSKTYWLWYWGNNTTDNVLGFNVFFAYEGPEGLKGFMEKHAEQFKNEPGYWSTYDKVGKEDAQMKIIKLT